MKQRHAVTAICLTILVLLTGCSQKSETTYLRQTKLSEQEEALAELVKTSGSAVIYEYRAGSGV